MSNNGGGKNAARVQRQHAFSGVEACLMGTDRGYFDYKYECRCQQQQYQDLRMTRRMSLAFIII